MAVLCLYYTQRIHRGLQGTRHLAIFVLSLLAYGLQLGLAVALILNPNDDGLVTDLAFTLIFAFALALTRAWELLQSEAVTPAGNGPAASPGGEARAQDVPQGA